MQKGNDMQGNLFVMPLWYNQEDWTGNEAQEDVIVWHPPRVSVMTVIWLHVCSHVTVCPWMYLPTLSLDTFIPLSAFNWQTDFVLWQSIPLWLTHSGIKPKVTRRLLSEQKNRESFFFSLTRQYGFSRPLTEISLHRGLTSPCGRMIKILRKMLICFLLGNKSVSFSGKPDGLIGLDSRANQEVSVSWDHYARSFCMSVQNELLEALGYQDVLVGRFIWPPKENK